MERKSGTDLKKRITIAFVFTILISVLFCAVLYFVLMRFTVKSIGREYGISNPRYENLYNNALLISRSMDEKLEELQARIESDPAVLEDRDELTRINAELEETTAFLVLTKGDAIYFNGADTVPFGQIKEVVSRFREPPKDEVLRAQAEDGSLVRQIGITYPDKTTGSLYMISRMERIAPEIRVWLSETLLLIIGILTIVSVLMGRWIYRGVERPIEDLRNATQNIRDGNLDVACKTSGIEELDELCQDFEEMRLRLKESTESKIENDRLSKELISNISHDLKTPITTIQGYVEGILDGIADTPEKMDHYLRTIRNKANDMDRLIDELTAYSHIDANRIPYNFIKIQASEYFSDCAEELSIDLEERGIAFKFFNYLQEEATIVVDPEQMKRVINNIIGNSIKYRDKEFAFVNLRLRDVGDFVQVEVEDNGKGIAQDDLPRIFDRMYRSDAARDTRGGSGIGLSIVKKILEDHEGKVWATSKEGEGTVIYFVLRKYKENEETEPADTGEKDGRTKKRASLPKIVRPKESRTQETKQKKANRIGLKK